MKQLISIKKLNSIVIPHYNHIGSDEYLVLSFNAELMRLGYILTKDAIDQLANNVPNDDVVYISDRVINTLKEIKGDNVQYTPMYPNFPQQVMDASYFELYTNAIFHYLTHGCWKPEYEKINRDFAIENIKYKPLDVVKESELQKTFELIVGSKDSISEEDKTFLKYFVDSGYEIPSEVPFKENMCFLATLVFNKGKDITPMIKTATDVLRVITSLSDGDISLAENTKFKSLPRKTRRYILSVLEDVINEEDIKRHANKWVKLFHNLHVGDFNFNKVNKIAKTLRDGEKLKTFNSGVEQYIKERDEIRLIETLKLRPSEFARRLCNILTISYPTGWITSRFLEVIDKIPTRNLTQLLGSIRTRYNVVDRRIVFPKGKTQKAIKLDTKLPTINSEIITTIIENIQKTLKKRFSDLKPLGKTYIDSELINCPLPTQMRSASTGAFNVARGTHIPFKNDKNILRFFIYWEGIDIDLSATFHNEDFKTIGHVSYTNLKSEEFQACHSGDIIRAPRGASEFIDITIDGALKKGVRYVAMNVFVFTGPNFSDHEICYAGWMMRDKPKSNEIYDPKTVEQKIDLTVKSRRAVPVIFDLQTREAIWLDLVGNSTNCYGNNVESNRASVEEVVASISNLDNKVSLAELFKLHAQSRGELVNAREKADTIFSFDGDITPYDVNVINSEFLV